MKRRKFLFLTSGTVLAAVYSMEHAFNDPEQIFLKDDGKIPNSKYPLLVYRNVFTERGSAGAAWLEKKFLQNNWSNSWRNGIYDFHHYHSVTHEVLGIFSGSALVHMGGESGKKLTVEAGDIIIIPAGVGHKNLESDHLGVVGAYPNGMMWDMQYGKEGERPGTDRNIAAVPFPKQDPLMGNSGGLLNSWH
jgi:uncharacterized protein YjlB